MKRKNSNQKMGVGDIVIAGTLGLAVTAVTSWVARGVKHAVTTTNWWQNKAYPWIDKTYNKCEDWRDEAIDEVKEMFNKKND